MLSQWRENWSLYVSPDIFKNLCPDQMYGNRMVEAINSGQLQPIWLILVLGPSYTATNNRQPVPPPAPMYVSECTLTAKEENSLKPEV